MPPILADCGHDRDARFLRLSLVFTVIVSFVAPESINASLYRESCFKTGPDGRAC